MSESKERRGFLPIAVLAAAAFPAIWWSHDSQATIAPVGPRFVNVAAFTQDELRGFNGNPDGEISFMIRVNRTKGTRVGMKFGDAEEGAGLKVEEVYPDGLVAEWNRLNPQKMIFAGDSLLEVNGEVEPAKIVEECSGGFKALDVVVARKSDGSILLAVWGRVFNVTSAPEFYGPGNGYKVFAGRESTRNMAITSTKKKELAKGIQDVTKLQLEMLNETYWETYVAKYPIVGVLSDSPFDPSDFDRFAGSWVDAQKPRRFEEVQLADTAGKNASKRESRCPVTRAAKSIGKTLAQFVPRMLLGGPADS